MDISERKENKREEPVGQSKDSTELRTDIVKDLQLSNEINFCGSRNVKWQSI